MDSADLPSMPRLLMTPEDGRQAEVEPGQISAQLLRHGSMELRWYAPQLNSEDGHDHQTPHDRDEVYVVASGTGVFIRAEEPAPFGDDLGLSLRGEERVAVAPGDTLFVPAGSAHRFEAMSADFGTWAIFYGPEGGETA